MGKRGWCYPTHMSSSFSVAELRGRLPALDAEVLKAEHELAAARAGVEEALQKLAQAQAMRSGAEAFIGVLEAETVRPNAMSSLSALRRPAERTFRQIGPTDVVYRILSDHPEGIDLHDVSRIADEQGSGLNAEQVRSAVTYLRRRGDAENVARGVWRLVGATPTNSTNSDISNVEAMSPQAPTPTTPEGETG